LIKAQKLSEGEDKKVELQVGQILENLLDLEG